MPYPLDGYIQQTQVQPWAPIHPQTILSAGKYSAQRMTFHQAMLTQAGYVKWLLGHSTTITEPNLRLFIRYLINHYMKTSEARYYHDTAPIQVPQAPYQMDSGATPHYMPAPMETPTFFSQNVEAAYLQGPVSDPPGFVTIPHDVLNTMITLMQNILQQQNQGQNPVVDAQMPIPARRRPRENGDGTMSDQPPTAEESEETA